MKKIYVIYRMTTSKRRYRLVAFYSSMRKAKKAYDLLVSTGVSSKYDYVLYSYSVF